MKMPGLPNHTLLFCASILLFFLNTAFSMPYYGVSKSPTYDFYFNSPYDEYVEEEPVSFIRSLNNFEGLEGLGFRENKDGKPEQRTWFEPRSVPQYTGWPAIQPNVRPMPQQISWPGLYQTNGPVPQQTGWPRPQPVGWPVMQQMNGPMPQYPNWPPKIYSGRRKNTEDKQYSSKVRANNENQKRAENPSVVTPETLIKNKPLKGKME